MNRVVHIGVWVGLIAVLLVSAEALSDTLVLTDGRTFQGRLIKKTDKEVVFEAIQFGTKIQVSFPPDQVSRITEGKVDPKTASTKPIAGKAAKKLPPAPKAPPIVKYKGPTYYLVPLRGQVGTHMLAVNLRKSLDDAMRRSPSVVILDIDSPGGMISEAQRIMAVLREYTGRLRIVTLAGRTLSAAAILSLSTREIYMRPAGMIGAATAFKMTSFGLPQAIDEKFQSTWRAVARSSAEAGGHNPLLAEAMIDNKVELHWVEQGGRKLVRRGRGRGRNVLTTRGRLLTMTAGEAVACGLAKGKVDTYDALGRALGMDTWTECRGLGTALARWWTDTVGKFDADIQKTKKAFLANLRRAEGARPNQPQYTYVYFRDTHRMVPQSQRKWRERSIACARFFRKAQKDLQAAIDLAGEMKGMKAFVENLQEMQTRVKEKADRVYRDRTNYIVRGRSR